MLDRKVLALKIIGSTITVLWGYAEFVYFYTAELSYIVDLKHPFNYVREECLMLDLSLSRLCRRAKVSRSTLYHWEGSTPSSIQTLARLEETLQRERIAGGRCALDKAAALIDALHSDPEAQAAVFDRLDALVDELTKQYAPH